MNAQATPRARLRADAARQWQSLPPRQRVLAAIAAGLLAGALAWWLLLGPALATLRAAPDQHRALDEQLLRMRALQAQASALQGMPRVGGDEARRALEASVPQRLGAGSRLAVVGDSATVTLAAVPPAALAEWLAQARIDARAIPTESRLARNAAGQWDGTLVLALPPR